LENFLLQNLFLEKDQKINFDLQTNLNKISEDASL